MGIKERKSLSMLWTQSGVKMSDKPAVLALVEFQTHKSYGEREGGKSRIVCFTEAAKEDVKARKEDLKSVRRTGL